MRPDATSASQAGLQRRLALLAGKAPGNSGRPLAPPQGLEARDLLAAAGPYWAKTIGSALDESAGLVRRTAASEFVFAGTFGNFISNTTDLWLIKIDSAGNRVWEKVYGGPWGEFGSIGAASDGGYLLYAESYDDQFSVVAFTLAKLDASGNITWQKKLLKDGNTTDVPDFAIPLSDGGFLLSGSEFSFTSNPPALVDLLIRVSSAGAVTWQKQYTRPSTDSLSGSVQALADNSLLHAGVKYVSPNFTNTDAWFRKLTSTGAVVFDKYIGGPESDSLYSVMPANGGGFIASGTTKSWVQPGDTVGNIWIVKFDANFNIVMQKSFGDTGQEYGSLTPLADGYLLSGYVRAANPALAGGAASSAAIDTAGDAFVAKLDNNLNVVWAKTYNAGGMESAYAGVDSSGGYLVSGTTDSNGRGTDILLAKLDANGNVTWARAYGGHDSESGYGFRIGSFPASAPGVQSLAPAVTDMVLAGTTRSFGAGGNDVLAALLDSNGQIAGCSLVQTVTLTATPWTIPVITTTATVTNNTPTATDIASYSVTNGALVVSTRTSTLADACNPAPVLTVTAAANTTSGSAPLTVNFTGSAVNGTPPYTWEWDFGDGSAKSTQQNPSHTYNDPGSYPVTLKVTDSAAASDTDDHLTIEVAGECALFCFSNVPTSGTAGQPVDYFGGAESANCTGSPTYLWTFGDGSTATTQGPTHAYASAGTFNWTLTVSQNGTSCTQDGTITITGGTVTTTTYWIPSAAHAPGAGGSKWRSNVGVVNRSGASASLTLLFVPYAAGSNVTRNHVLANGATVEWADVLVSLFGFADSANTKGTVKITSDRTIVAMSRTYNQAATGTFGQYYPALVVAQGIGSTQAGVLPLLKKNTAFRANVGFQNLGPDSCSGEVKLFNAAGAQVGSTRTLTAAGDKYIQEDDVFAKAGAGTQNVAYARVQPTTAGCKAWFFGSVVDAATNDPTTVPQQLSAAGPFWVPSIAHAPGLSGSKWRSNIAVVNRSGATANLTLDFIPYAAGATVTRNHVLANNNTIEWADVLVSLFGFADSANTKGTVRITSDRSLFAMARTYNQAATGTFGQYYPALLASQSITNGQTAVLPLLKKTAGFRSNAGFQNLGAASCTGTVKLYNAAGAQVGSTRTLTAVLDKYIQDDDVFAKAAAGNQEPAYAVVEVTTASGKAWFFGSVIDAVTNDPTTIPQQQ